MQIAYGFTGKLIHVDPEYGFYWTIKDYPGSSRAIMSEPWFTGLKDYQD